MRYLSVCSGIEAATVAWRPLGWHAHAFSEIDTFPSAVLTHHYPTVPNWGDMTRFKDWPDATLDLLVGGTPCQSFSVAGLRRGLADPRGNLALTYLGVLDRYRPRWMAWENVPGVLSSGRGRDFGAFLGALGHLGYGFAYRVLDAQYFGLAQRRRRVFVVGYLGDWRRAAAVLFERESLSGHPAPRRETGQAVTTVPSRRSAGGGLGTDFDDGGLIASTGDISHCLNAGGMGEIDYESETLIAHSLRADGFDASEDGTGRGTPIVPTNAPIAFRGKQAGEYGHDLSPTLDGGGGGGFGAFAAVAFSAKDDGADAGELAPTLRAGGFTKSHANGGCMPAIAFDTTQITSGANYSNPKPGDPCHPLAAGAHPPAVAFQESQSGFRSTDAHPTLDSHNGSRRHHGVQQGLQVRRLTPRECERLQGFPDDYTLTPYRGKLAADGPRYKALGNSMAVPVVRWLGERIAMVDAIAADSQKVA